MLQKIRLGLRLSLLFSFFLYSTLALAQDNGARNSKSNGIEKLRDNSNLIKRDKSLRSVEDLLENNNGNKLWAGNGIPGLSVLYHEPFNNDDNLEIEIVDNAKARRYREENGDVLTFSVSNNLGPGSDASTPGNRFPPIFRLARGSYFVGRLGDAEGTVSTRDYIDVRGRQDVRVFLRMAAAEDENDYFSQNHFDNKDRLKVHLWFMFDGKSPRSKRLDLFTGGNPLKDKKFSKKNSPLQSRDSDRDIHTNFRFFGWRLSDILGKNVDRVSHIKIAITATTDDEHIGLDDLYITAAPGEADECPYDINKTEPGICGCGTPDTDSDNDGTADCIDECPADGNKTEPGICGCGTADADSDNDGTLNCIDGCPEDPDKIEFGVCGCGIADSDSDGDGNVDCEDSCPADPDKNSPGVCGCGISDIDSDGDGTADCIDQCPADGNKIIPGSCGCGTLDTDTDSDGAPDCNDQCPADSSKTEPGLCGCGTSDADSDGDGTPNCQDECANDSNKTTPGACGCGTPDSDSDGDGNPDCEDSCPADPDKNSPGICGCGTPDTDSDNDGTPDCNDFCADDAAKTEPGICGCGLADTDSDGDGTADCNDQCVNDPGKIEPGTCGCGIADSDSDGDGNPDCQDTCPDDPLKNAPGICGCGIADTDTDGDGTPDCNDECAADANKTASGACGCGVADTDSDGDGTPDCNDECSADANKTQPGTCGCGVADTDSDNDGTADCNDECSADANKTTPGICGCGISDTDTDGDGTADCNDQCQSDANKTEPGVCGCGIADTDSDGDGTADCNDQCSSDPAKTQPGTCGCGVADTDTDGDGTADCNDQCQSDANKTEPGVCGCGIADTDSDGDGTADCNDQCSSDANKTTPGVCGCGVSDADTDADGTPDCNDSCSSDPTKTEPGICGCGTADTDSDGDGTADCNDQCENDPNKTEPGSCGCGVADTDSDGDGVLDCEESCPNDPDKIEPGVCGCGISDDTPLCLFNGDFQTGDLTNWTADENASGDITVMQDGEPGNFAAQMTTGSPVSLTIKVNTPAEDFYLLFDTKFKSTSGTLSVSIDGTVVATLPAPAAADTDFNVQEYLITDPFLKGLNLTDLVFIFDGPNGSQVLIDNIVLIPGSAGEQCVLGGDNIGNDGSSVNGNGAVSAHGGNLEGPLSNRGNPAIPYTADGSTLLTDVRIIAAVIPDYDDGGGAVDWSNQEWVIAIFDSVDYQNEQTTPVVAHSFGAEPDNWRGFTVFSPVLTTPDTEPFGNYGDTGQKSEDLYDLQFNLENVLAFNNPLPAGDYFITLQSIANTESYGEAGVGLTVNGLGPDYWYDNNQMTPRPIYPNLTSNPDLGIAFSVTVKKLVCE